MPILEDYLTFQITFDQNRLIQVILLKPTHLRYRMTTCVPRIKGQDKQAQPPHQKQNNALTKIA